MTEPVRWPGAGSNRRPFRFQSERTCIRGGPRSDRSTRHRGHSAPSPDIPLAGHVSLSVAEADPLAHSWQLGLRATQEPSDAQDLRRRGAAVPRVVRVERRCAFGSVEPESLHRPPARPRSCSRDRSQPTARRPSLRCPARRGRSDRHRPFPRHQVAQAPPREATRAAPPAAGRFAGNAGSCPTSPVCSAPGSPGGQARCEDGKKF